MSSEIQQQPQQRDYFWLYIGAVTIALVGIIGMVKMSENEKYDPIAKQQQEEIRSMNIHVLKEY